MSIEESWREAYFGNKLTQLFRCQRYNKINSPQKLFIIAASACRFVISRFVWAYIKIKLWCVYKHKRNGFFWYDVIRSHIILSFPSHDYSKYCFIFFQLLFIMFFKNSFMLVFWLQVSLIKCILGIATLTFPSIMFLYSFFFFFYHGVHFCVFHLHWLQGSPRSEVANKIELAMCLKVRK